MAAQEVGRSCDVLPLQPLGGDDRRLLDLCYRCLYPDPLGQQGRLAIQPKGTEDEGQGKGQWHFFPKEKEGAIMKVEMTKLAQLLH